MSNKLTIMCIVLVTAGLTGCKKFLDLPPKNQRTVTTVEDIKYLLGAQLRGVTKLDIKPLYGNIVPACPSEAVMMFEAYSDNIDFETALTKNYLQPNNRYMNEKGYADLLLWNQHSTSTLLWSHHYLIIGFLNSLIDQMPQIKNASNAERDQLLGEMYANRAYSLFKLLEYYAPYDKPNMGIPVYLHTGEGVLGIQPFRKTHAEVYAIILEDLNKAMEMINRTAPIAGFSALYNVRFLNHLLAQVYWYKAESPAKEPGDYEKVRTYSMAALDAADAYIPVTASARISSYAGLNPNYPVICQQNNFSGVVAPIYGSEYQYYDAGAYGPSNLPLTAEFAALFNDGDIRIENYFNVKPERAEGRVGTAGKVLNWAWPADGTEYGGDKGGQVCIFKPEEAYLMLAEAQYRLNSGDALNTLNKFRSFRNAGTLSNLSGTALLQEIINERRREFFGDSDKRWLDLKRYAYKTINRNVTFFKKQYSITVPPNDFRYALPIPLIEIQQNKNIVPNPGWQILEY